MKTELEPFVKKSVIAKHLGFSTKTMDRWVDERGCPCFEAPGGERTYQINAVVKWASSQTSRRMPRMLLLLSLSKGEHNIIFVLQVCKCMHHKKEIENVCEEVWRNISHGCEYTHEDEWCASQKGNGRSSNFVFCCKSVAGFPTYD